ncbi:YcaO-like family protein [Mesorhizobium sp. L-8-3]|uniref:YcaO-like family protein n=1 Tax=Mesorhizobium sp. L-8-3 TaxID=2744522 RepID=UPI0019287713|nr:YcaO-like family protein [Mesorhizobium sp. L-8-3]
MTVDIFDVPGGFIAATRLGLGEGAGSREVTASGKGFDPARAVLSCLGEAVETHSWMHQRADGAKLVRSSEAGDLRMLPPARILGFSATQVRHRDRYNRLWADWDAVPPAGQLSRPDLWSTVSDLDGSSIALCPAFLCHGGFGEAVYGDSSLNADSNGCAAGASWRAAQSRAVLELVERDATGIWWWPGCVRTRLSPGLFGDPDLSKALAEHRDQTGRRVWFLDISTFRNAHAVAALSCDRNGKQIAVGFAAAFVLGDALRSSFLEMIQTELALDAHEIRKARNMPMSNADLRLATWLVESDIKRLDFLCGQDGTIAEEASGMVGTLPGLVEEMSAATGESAWFRDLSRPETGVRVAKAICPGLAHFKPRWGCDRPWKLPGQRGWRTTYGRRGLRSRPPLP